MSITREHVRLAREAIFISSYDAGSAVDVLLNRVLDQSAPNYLAQIATLKTNASAITKLKAARQYPTTLAEPLYVMALDALGAELGVNLNAGPLTPAPETPAPIPPKPPTPPAPAPSVQPPAPAPANASPATVALLAELAAVYGIHIEQGKIGLGAPCKPGTKEQIQLFSQRGTGVLAFSNLSGKNSQGAQTHVSALTFGEDGGLRLEHNYWFQNDQGVWQESAKPRTIVGMDSLGTPSISQDVDGVIDDSQSLIIVFDRSLRRIFLDSMKAGWKWAFRASTLTNHFDKRYDVPTP